MLPGAVNFSRQGLNVNLNDGNGVNLSSNSTMSLSAGKIGLDAEEVTITAGIKLKTLKNESSFISLDGQYITKSANVYEDGSDRQSYENFKDGPDATMPGLPFNSASLIGANDGATPVIRDLLGSTNTQFNLYSKNSLINTSNRQVKNESYITKPSKDDVPIHSYRVNVGESGDGF